MSNTILYKDIIAFHPGAYIEDVIDDLNITQYEFATRMGTSPKIISTLVRGKSNLNPELACKLANLTGIDAGTWLNIQNEYELKMLEIKEAKERDDFNSSIDDDLLIISKIDFNYFKKYGLVEDRRYSKREKVAALCEILRVSNLQYLLTFNPLVSYRNTANKFSESNIINSNIMLELAMNKARKRPSTPFNQTRLTANLEKIHALIKLDPDAFYPKLVSILEECGIILVGLPALKNANLNGATKRFKDGSVLLLLSDHRKRSDIFWFSLMHEIGHIYYKDGCHVGKNVSKKEYLAREAKADAYARDFLINPKQYSEFVSYQDFSEHSVSSFAKEADVLPSIVVGRLQNDGHIEYAQLNHLCRMYEFSYRKA